MVQATQAASTRWAHVFLRIFAGAVICEHGAQKLFGVLGGIDGAGHAAVINFTLRGIAGPLEFFGGLLIILGLFTRGVAFILSGEMAVAYFLMHSPRGFWPIANHGELPVILCFVFLYIAATGAGVFSLDYLRTRNRPSSIMG
jgi:putative oxidoreductase